MAPTSSSTDPAARAVEDVLDEVNASFTRLKPGREPPTQGEHECLHASREGSEYVRAFWSHILRMIDQDPRKLGMSTALSGEGADARRTVDDIRQSFLERHLASVDEREVRLLASVLAPLTMMSEVLNGATESWAEELQAAERQGGLSFDVDPSRFVSLRTLFPMKQREGPVGGNAPTLVLGGTAPAVAMSWNMLYQMPHAYRDLAGREVERETAEQVWAQTRELIFRMGSGSMAAFVAFAGACSSDASALVWDGAHDLGLTIVDDSYVWTMNDALVDRFRRLAATVTDPQQGHYVGCAALFARTDPLPLTAEFADAVTDGQPTVFSELIRWITAVARAEFFGQFPSGDAD